MWAAVSPSAAPSPGAASVVSVGGDADGMAGTVSFEARGSFAVLEAFAAVAAEAESSSPSAAMLVLFPEDGLSFDLDFGGDAGAADG